MLLKYLNTDLGLKKYIGLIMVLTMLLSLPGFVNPRSAAAVCGSVGVPADTLTVKVGYFGGPYYTKKVYTLTDFDALPQVQQAYTYIDNLPAICIDSASGVKLTDLLIDAGIDVNSVQKFYFYATDVKKGWYQCLDKSYLLDTPRYYYPNLPSHWDYETQKPKEGALDGAVLTDAIIAYKDNWQRYADAPDFSTYDTSTRFRLLFGQNGTSAHNAPESAKWVHSIEVMLGGMPPEQVTLDKNWVRSKVGSTFKLTANVAPDDATDKSVTWSSSNTAAATVDQNGLVTVVGEGMAIITVHTIIGELTAACVVNGPEPNSVSQTKGSQMDRAGPPGTPSNSQHLADKDTGAAAISPQEAGVQPWRVFAMSTDAVPLQQPKTKNSLDIYAAISFGLLFLWGSGRKYSEYTREVER